MERPAYLAPEGGTRGTTKDQGEGSIDSTRARHRKRTRVCEHLDLDGCLVKDIFDQTIHPIIMLESDGTLLVANTSAIEMFSLLPGGGQDETWLSDHFERSEVAAIKEDFKHTLRGRMIRRGTAKLADRLRTVSYEMMPLNNADGDVRAIVMIFDDVTEEMESKRLNVAINLVHEAINSTLEFDAIMQRVVELNRTVMYADSTSILIKKDEAWWADYVSGGFERGLMFSTEEVQRSLSALASEEIFAVEDVMSTDEAFRDCCASLHVRSVIAVPLRQRGSITGLMFFNYREPRRFSQVQLDYVARMGAAVSIAAENSTILEREMQERRLLQQIIDKAPANIALLSYPEMKITLINTGFKKIMKERSDFRAIVRSMPPQAAKMALEIIDQAYRTGKGSVNSEIPISLPDGSVLYWTVYTVPLPDQPEGTIFVMAVDVTNQVENLKRIEDLVRAVDIERSRLETALNTMPVAVLVTNKDGKVEIANDMFRSFVDLENDNIIPQLHKLEGRWADTGIKLKKEDWPVVTALNGKRIDGDLIDVKLENGEARTLIGAASPIYRGDEITGAVTAFSDITAQRRAEQEAIHAKGQMELYLDLLSHDVNNLNAGARGYMELLLSKEVLTGKPLHYAESANDLLEDISQLVDNVRKLQKAEAEGYCRSAIDLNWLLDDIIAAYRNIPSRDVATEYKPSGRALVFGNELLRDVFDNILGNAVKHTSGAVRIEVTVGQVLLEGREFHRVDIADNGPGIPDNVKDVLFNRMQQGRTTAKGHGLGLYLVRTVLNMFDGQVWADDRVPGDHTKGSRFVVLLPSAGSEAPSY